MRSLFAISLLGAVSLAATRDGNKPEEYIKFKAPRSQVTFMDDDQQDDDPEQPYKLNEVRRNQSVEFNKFVASHNKQYGSRGEYKRREQNWIRNQQIIEQMNNNSESMAQFGVNFAADLDDDERQSLYGLDQDAIGDHNLHSLTNNDEHDGLRGNAINWVDQGKVHEVKDQGWCGSCWAFAAALALESKVAIENDTTPVRLSEQQGVDCTTDTNKNKKKFGKTYGCWGCEGCWMENYWKFSKDQGSMPDSEYPYTGTDDKCKHDESKAVVRAGKITQINGDVSEARDAIQDGPFAIAVGASGGCWDNYTGGILSSKDNCNTQLDHAVTVVGLGTETITRTVKREQREQEYEYDCKISWTGFCKRNRFRIFMFPFVYCCKETEIEPDEDENDNDNDDEETEEFDQEYWLIQNSWGTGWGDNGFIKLAVEGGVGVSGMNQVMETIGTKPL